LLTLTLADTTGALQTDGSGHVAGLTASEIESNLVNSITLDVPSISADMAAGDISTDLNMWFLCAGTFVNGCGAGTYQWNWGSSADWTTPQPSSSLSFATNLNVPDGGSQDFTFGTFTPNGAPAPPGTYTWGLGEPDGSGGFAATSLFVEVYDKNWTDPSNPGNHYIADISIASTPTGGIFQRTVVGAPEPSTSAEIVVMASGLFALLLFRRSRRHFA
jgi:hypothetical protein